MVRNVWMKQWNASVHSSSSNAPADMHSARAHVVRARRHRPRANGTRVARGSLYNAGRERQPFLHLSRNHTPGTANCTVATVSYAGHFAVLAQWFLSFEVNVADVGACDLLVVTSNVAESLQLQRLLDDGFAERLPRVMRQLVRR